MVVKYTGEELYKSTYASLYAKTPEDTLKRQNFHQLPRMCELEGNDVVPRNHPDYIGKRKYVRPPGLAHDDPICLGLGSFVQVPIQNTGKPIVRTRPPQERQINLGNLKIKSRQLSKAACKGKERQGETLDEMVSRLRWIATTKRVQENSCLPVPKWKVPNTTLEENSDVVRHRPQRYEQKACEWQKLSNAWNRIQFRPNLTSKGDLGDVKRTTFEICQSTNDHLKCDITDSNMAHQCRHRKLPGYAGFVPREPVTSRMDPSSSEIYRSSASRTYRHFPHDVMHDPRTMSNHRDAPMSRMITLVYPWNPYKKTPNTTHTFINPIYHR